LTANTTYYMHATEEDAAANKATVVTSASFTTDPNTVVSEAVVFTEDESADATTAATHLSGTVLRDDTSDVALTSHPVIALNRSTNAAVVVTTNASGEYVFAGLTPGQEYTVIPDVYDTGGTFRADPQVLTPSQ